MKSYVIAIETDHISNQWADDTIQSGKTHGWNIEKFFGIDGKLKTLDDYQLKINDRNKKCHRNMQRPGTQGCFLSHYMLWNHCVDGNENVAIFEHDAILNKPLSGNCIIRDVLKLEGFVPSKPIYCGQWWEGARAYIVSPAGAEKLIKFVLEQGALPADVMLNSGIVDIDFDLSGVATFDKKDFSYTVDYK